MQDTFIYLLGKFPGLRLTGRLTTLLYPAIKNLSIDIARKRIRQDASSSPIPENAATRASIDPDSQRSELALAMASLGESHREVMLMRFVDDMTVNEIAATLTIPEGTVKSRLHHAIAALRADPRTLRYFFEK
jgi:RNA polymerase sigma-70 factor (ECF subfamily)